MSRTWLGTLTTTTSTLAVVANFSTATISNSKNKDAELVSYFPSTFNIWINNICINKIEIDRRF